MPSSILRVSGVVKRFGSTVALDGLDLSIDAGEVLALMGANGAGKSTLVKMLAGVHRPDTGTLTLGGRPFAPASRHQLEQQTQNELHRY